MIRTSWMQSRLKRRAAQAPFAYIHSTTGLCHQVIRRHIERFYPSPGNKDAQETNKRHFVSGKAWHCLAWHLCASSRCNAVSLHFQNLPEELRWCRRPNRRIRSLPTGIWRMHRRARWFQTLKVVQNKGMAKPSGLAARYSSHNNGRVTLRRRSSFLT
jgi:hypothetical protein